MVPRITRSDVGGTGALPGVLYSVILTYDIRPDVNEQLMAWTAANRVTTGRAVGGNPIGC